MAIIAIGHPGNIDDLHEVFIDDGLGERIRKPINDRFIEVPGENPLVRNVLIKN